MLARKMQPDFSKDLAKRLYDLLHTARIIPLAEVGVDDGDRKSFPRFSHDHVNIWIRRSPDYKAVRGWVIFDFSSNATFRASFVRFAAHSVIEAPDGALWDITRRYTSQPHPFIRHPGTDEDFDQLRADGVLHVDHYLQWCVAELLPAIQSIQVWFTEGFDTRDLKEAKALLEELAR